MFDLYIEIQWNPHVLVLLQYIHLFSQLSQQKLPTKGWPYGPRHLTQRQAAAPYGEAWPVGAAAMPWGHEQGHEHGHMLKQTLEKCWKRLKNVEKMDLLAKNDVSIVQNDLPIQWSNW